MRNNAIMHALAIYIINALHSTCTQTLLYYELSLAARAAPSQLCLQDKACSGCSYMVEYYTERVQQGASEVSPPACNNNNYINYTNRIEFI